MKKTFKTGALLVFLASCCYGIMPIFTKTSLSLLDNKNESVIAYAMLFACIMTLVVSLVRKKSVKNLLESLKVSKKQLLHLALFGGVCMLLTMLLLSYSYNYIPVGTSIVIHFTYPILVSIASTVFFKEKMSVAKIIAIVLAFIGIILESGIKALSGDGNEILGVLLALASAFTYASYFIASKHSAYKDVESTTATVYITAFASLVGFVLALISGRFIFINSFNALFVLIGQGFTGYVLAALLLLNGIKILGSSNASIINTLEPVIATIAGVVMYGDNVPIIKIIGCVLIVSASVILVLSSRKSE